MLSISYATMFLRLGLAMLLGAIIGIERESREHEAGMRTNALVALGACFFMIISIYGFAGFLTVPHVQLDPSRVASYVVAGIGFLGAGTILRRQDGNKVKGLTTAATIFVVAAVGLACGTGMLVEAVGATVLTLVILILLRSLEIAFLPHKSLDRHKITVEVAAVDEQMMKDIYSICAQVHTSIEALEIRKAQSTETIQIICTLREAAMLLRLVSELQNLPQVQAVHSDLRNMRSSIRAKVDEA